MAERRKFKVSTRKSGLNLREEPSKKSKIIRLLPNGADVILDKEVEVPDGWVAVKGGGFVMSEFLK